MSFHGPEPDFVRCMKRHARYIHYASVKEGEGEKRNNQVRLGGSALLEQLQCRNKHGPAKREKRANWRVCDLLPSGDELVKG